MRVRLYAPERRWTSRGCRIGLQTAPARWLTWPCAMTASLPPEIQQVFDRFITTRVHDRRGPGQPITWPVTPYYRPGRPLHRPDHRARVSEEGERRARRPRGSALLFSDPTGSGTDERAAGARAGHRRGGRPRPRREPRALRARVAREAPRHGRRSCRPKPLRRMFRLVLHAHLRARAPGARVRVARRRRGARAGAFRRPPGGGALGPRRGARRRARAHARRRIPPGTSGWTSSGSATRRPWSRWCRPTASPSRCGCPSPWTGPRAGSAWAARRWAFPGSPAWPA